MTRYIVRRLLQTVPVLFGVSLLAFAIMHVVPGDPVRLIAGPDAPEFVVQRVRAELGLERPLYVQYWSFLSRALQGDLGRSLRSRAPVTGEIWSRFPATLELTTVSMVMAVLLRRPLGLLAPLRPPSSLSHPAPRASPAWPGACRFRPPPCPSSGSRSGPSGSSACSWDGSRCPDALAPSGNGTAFATSSSRRRRSPRRPWPSSAASRARACST